jgi:agmatine/peptidylarginine deiminase
MPGEFEQQQFLFLSCGDLTLGHAETIADIATAVHRHIRVVVLFTSEDQREEVIQTLNQRFDSTDRVLFLRMEHDSKWIRDFGPTVLRHGAKSVVVDWQYDQDRPNDDQVPLFLAAASNTPCEPAPLRVEGGNLLSNGLGLCVTTTAMVARNAGEYSGERAVCNALKKSVGAQQVVVLEPLAGEETGHVDMFMTFTGPNTVVVGAYSPRQDSVNAALLDRNAARLASIETPWGRLRVERVPMGRQHDGLWRTYTNCVYANGVLLVPIYQDGDHSRSQQALALFRRLLPQWRIVPIDATEIIEDGGALHCASLNVPCLASPLNLDRLAVEDAAQLLIEFESTARHLP